MSYHNIRDKYGRFTKAKTKTSQKAGKGPDKDAAPKVKKVNNRTKTIFNCMLLDYTASMSSKRKETVDGYNLVLSETYVAAQKANVNNINYLVMFGEDGYYQERSNDPLTLLTYFPNRGATALWWAIIKMIGVMDEKVKILPAGTRVVLTIFTDGENNQSGWLLDSARVLVESRKSQGWVINFVGAGDEVFVKQVAESVGIFAANTLSYDNSAAGTTRAMSKMSASRTSYVDQVSRGTDSNTGFFSNS